MKRVQLDDVLDAAASLPPDAREELVEILHKRAVEERRQEMAREIGGARSEHRRGGCRAVSPKALMKEILA